MNVICPVSDVLVAFPLVPVQFGLVGELGWTQRTEEALDTGVHVGVSGEVLPRHEALPTHPAAELRRVHVALLHVALHATRGFEPLATQIAHQRPATFRIRHWRLHPETLNRASKLRLVP